MPPKMCGENKNYNYNTKEKEKEKGRPNFCCCRLNLSAV